MAGYKISIEVDTATEFKELLGSLGIINSTKASVVREGKGSEVTTPTKGSLPVSKSKTTEADRIACREFAHELMGKSAEHKVKVRALIKEFAPSGRLSDVEDIPELMKCLGAL